MAKREQVEVDYHFNQLEVAELLFIDPKTVYATEKRALAKMRQIFAERGITFADLEVE